MEPGDGSPSSQQCQDESFAALQFTGEGQTRGPVRFPVPVVGVDVGTLQQSAELGQIATQQRCQEVLLFQRTLAVSTRFEHGVLHRRANPIKTWLNNTAFYKGNMRVHVLSKVPIHPCSSELSLFSFSVAHLISVFQGHSNLSLVTSLL